MPLACVAIALLWRAPAETAQRPVTWLIFVDDLHLEFRNTGRIRDFLRMVSSELIQDGDRFAIASAGPSKVTVTLTSNRQAFDPAIKLVIGSALRLDDVLQSRGGVGEALLRASTALAGAQSLADRHPGDDAPTALLYLSNGYNVDLLPMPSPDTPRSVPGRTVTLSMVHEQLRNLADGAAARGIRIFAIEPVTSVELGAGIDPRWPAHQTEMRRVMSSLAETTGGLAIVGGDATTHLKRIAGVMR